MFKIRRHVKYCLLLVAGLLNIFENGGQHMTMLMYVIAFVSIVSVSVQVSFSPGSN